MSGFASALPRGIKRPRGFSAGKTKAQGRRAVQRSGEIARILALPRRPEGGYDRAFADAMSMELVGEGSDFRLKPKQAAMLVEAVEGGGLFGMLGVGGGKTVAAPLFGHVMDVSPVVLLVPPAIKKEIESRVVPWLRRHISFIEPTIVSYSELSTAGKGDLLDRLRPRLIVADEVHLLKNKGAARTKRFLRYFDENPNTMLVALSGTITRRSLMDFWHLMQLTHKGWRLPLSRHWKEVKDWSLALDPQVPGDQRLLPGALLEFCKPGEDARAGFRRRMLETDGVIGGNAEDVGASLVIRKLGLELPRSVAQALEQLRKKWETPGGEQITDALDFARKARELAQGFYYVWDWPGGEPDEAWLFARSEWRKAVADVCKLNRQGLDSELLVRNAADRELKESWRDEDARLPKAQRERVVEAWRAWCEVKEQDEPPVRAVWIDDFVVRAAIKWGEEAEANADTGGGLIWYDSRAIEERAGSLGARVCGAGPNGNNDLLAHAEGRNGRAPSIFLSAHAHGTGKNLQRWNRNLVLAPWPSGADWEQRIGRTHRPGQDADEVTADVFVHTPELQKAIDSAQEQARYIEEVTGGAQKLLMATWIEGRQ